MNWVLVGILVGIGFMLAPGLIEVFWRLALVGVVVVVVGWLISALLAALPPIPHWLNMGFGWMMIALFGWGAVIQIRETYRRLLVWAKGKRLLPDLGQ